MKIHHFVLIALIAVFTSCSKEQETTQSTEGDIPVSQVSERINSYVDENYPDAYIYSAVSLTNCAARTIITLNTTEELAFNSSDDFMGRGENYHADHHVGGHHGHDGLGHGEGHGHCHGFDHGAFNNIPVDSLPTTITAYISSNYPGYTIFHAETDSSCAAGATIQVMVGTMGSPHVKLIFDNSGNYLMTASRIDYVNTPSAVQNSVATNYAGYTPRQRSEMFTLANNSVQYGVFLFNGTTHKRVILADDGTVICEQ
jgi:hypothetical protein